MRTTLLSLLALALSAPIAIAQSDASPAERSLLQQANQARAAHNLPPLHWDSNLAHAAHTHLQRVVQEPGDYQHQYPGEPDLKTRGAQAGANFSAIAENIGGHAEDPTTLQKTWMTSPTHRANLLDPNLNAVGIAVTQVGSLLYAVEDFAHSVSVLQTSDIEKRVSQLLLEHGIAPADSNADAIATCEMPKGNAGTPKLVVQWDGPNPTDLPDVLLRSIATGSYRTAQVGACASQQSNAQFTLYHVAVLLY
jgi:Cysteine-rich secretory protein family